MLTTVITDKTRRWNPFRRRRFTIELPENWDDLGSPRRRARWWRWALTLPRPAADRAMVRDCLRKLPGRIRRGLTDLDLGAFALNLAWVSVEPDCKQLAIPSFEHRRRRYHFPTPKGTNVTCIEYPLADDYYRQFVEGKDEQALLLLLATLAREEDADEAGTLRRGDKRVPLHSRDEIEARAHRLRNVPAEVQLQALMYFAGLKAYIARVYGSWLFDMPEEEEEEEENPEEVEPAQDTRYPDFGWWGIFQSVAESGVFGNLDQVYQASLHDICIYLVRKRVEAEQQKEALAAMHKRPPTDTD